MVGMHSDLDELLLCSTNSTALVVAVGPKLPNNLHAGDSCGPKTVSPETATKLALAVSLVTDTHSFTS